MSQCVAFDYFNVDCEKQFLSKVTLPVTSYSIWAPAKAKGPHFRRVPGAQRVYFDYCYDVILTGTLIPLNGACTSRDTCEDVNAACLRGFCRCRSAYFEQQGVCGTRFIPHGSNNRLLCQTTLDEYYKEHIE